MEEEVVVVEEEIAMNVVLANDDGASSPTPASAVLYASRVYIYIYIWHVHL